MGKSTYWRMERINKNTRIVVIGAGNVATHLATALSEKLDIVQIFSNSEENAHLLASKIGCDSFTSCTDNIVADADIYIIAIKDDEIGSLVSKIKSFKDSALWVHTSGSKPITLFENKIKNYGVLYPLQTFSKDVEVNFSEIPFFIEANNNENANCIKELAHMLSPRVYEADSDKRRQLHIAAVYACNFANYMWILADEVMTEADLPFDILLPLIRSSVSKLEIVSPEQSQTGPAIRKDVKVIDEHLNILTGNKENIYKILSDSIIASVNNHK